METCAFFSESRRSYLIKTSVGLGILISAVHVQVLKCYIIMASVKIIAFTCC